MPCGKPAPDVYLEALRRTGCNDASKALIIEDAVHGLQAAKAAGAFAVGICNTLPAERLRPHADLLISHLTDLDLATLRPDVKHVRPASNTGDLMPLEV